MVAGLGFVAIRDNVVCLISGSGSLEVNLVWGWASGRGVGVGNGDGWVVGLVHVYWDGSGGCGVVLVWVVLVWLLGRTWECV